MNRFPRRTGIVCCLAVIAFVSACSGGSTATPPDSPDPDSPGGVPTTPPTNPTIPASDDVLVSRAKKALVFPEVIAVSSAVLLPDSLYGVNIEWSATNATLEDGATFGKKLSYTVSSTRTDIILVASLTKGKVTDVATFSIRAQTGLTDEAYLESAEAYLKTACENGGIRYVSMIGRGLLAPWFGVNGVTLSTCTGASNPNLSWDSLYADVVVRYGVADAEVDCVMTLSAGTLARVVSVKALIPAVGDSASFIFDYDDLDLSITDATLSAIEDSETELYAITGKGNGSITVRRTGYVDSGISYTVRAYLERGEDYRAFTQLETKQLITKKMFYNLMYSMNIDGSAEPNDAFYTKLLTSSFEDYFTGKTALDIKNMSEADFSAIIKSIVADEYRKNYRRLNCSVPQSPSFADLLDKICAYETAAHTYSYEIRWSSPYNQNYTTGTYGYQFISERKHDANLPWYCQEGEYKTDSDDELEFAGYILGKPQGEIELDGQSVIVTYTEAFDGFTENDSGKVWTLQDLGDRVVCTSGATEKTFIFRGDSLVD